MVFIEKKISEKKKRGVQRSCDRYKGDGRGGDERGVANGHMTVGGVGERRKGRGARQAHHFGPIGPFTLGQSGPSF